MNTELGDMVYDDRECKAGEAAYLAGKPLNEYAGRWWKWGWKAHERTGVGKCAYDESGAARIARDADKSWQWEADSRRLEYRR